MTRTRAVLATATVAALGVAAYRHRQQLHTRAAVLRNAALGRPVAYRLHLTDTLALGPRTRNAIIAECEFTLSPDGVGIAVGTPDPDPLPERGSQVEAWIRRAREQYTPGDPCWTALDYLLDDYRLHADTGTPLDRHACDGPGCSHPDHEPNAETIS